MTSFSNSQIVHGMLYSGFIIYAPKYPGPVTFHNFIIYFIVFELSLNDMRNGTRTALQAYIVSICATVFTRPSVLLTPRTYGGRSGHCLCRVQGEI